MKPSDYDGRGYDPPYPSLADDNAMLVEDNQKLRKDNERLKRERDEARKLLREINAAPMQIGRDSLHVSVSTGLYKRIKEAAKAGGE